MSRRWSLILKVSILPADSSLIQARPLPLQLVVVAPPFNALASHLGVATVWDAATEDMKQGNWLDGKMFFTTQNIILKYDADVSGFNISGI